MCINNQLLDTFRSDHFFSFVWQVKQIYTKCKGCNKVHMKYIRENMIFQRRIWLLRSLVFWSDQGGSWCWWSILRERGTRKKGTNICKVRGFKKSVNIDSFEERFKETIVQVSTVSRSLGICQRTCHVGNEKSLG